jgi:hypothetical protein
VTILVESEDLQAQIWAIVGNIYPPLIDLIELKNHDHDGSPTVQLTASGLATDAVETAKIKNLHVTSVKLAAGAVVAGKIAAGAVNTSEIATNAVTGPEIANAAVGQAEIANEAVIAGKIATNAVSNSKIANGAVTSAKLGANAVIAGKIASGAINSSSDFASGVVDDSAIGAQQVGSSELKSDAVTAGKIAVGGVAATNELANNIVDDTKIGNRVVALCKRQGSNPGNWASEGTTDYIPTNVRMQVGSIEWTGGANNKGNKSVTFPIAFPDIPLVFAIASHGHADFNVCANANPNNAVIYWESLDGAQYTSVTLHWLAIGAE